MKTIDYLELLRPLTETGTDYSIAKLLEIDRRLVSNYKKGTTFSDEIALKVAHTLNIAPAIVLADIHAELAGRAKRTEEKTVWEDLASMLRNVAALVLLGIFLGGAAPTEAAERSSSFSPEYTLCAIVDISPPGQSQDDLSPLSGDNH